MPDWYLEVRGQRRPTTGSHEENMSNKTIQILIVDDHFIARKGIHSLVGDAADIEVSGEAADGAEAVRRVRELDPDIVLMDLIMPGMDGVTAIRRILDADPERRIIVLTGAGTEYQILDAVRAGALGYLSKGASPEACLRAIRQIDRGEAALPISVTRELLRQVGEAAAPDPRGQALTPREIEVLGLVARGWEDREIGDHLFISRGTVRTHVSNILAKLQLRNRVEAALYALRCGVVTLGEETGADGA